MSKLTGTKLRKAVATLRKELDIQYTDAEQSTLEWFPDIETDISYTWKFCFPSDSKIRHMTYLKDMGTVVTRRLD